MACAAAVQVTHFRFKASPNKDHGILRSLTYVPCHPAHNVWGSTEQPHYVSEHRRGCVARMSPSSPRAHAIPPTEPRPIINARNPSTSTRTRPPENDRPLPPPPSSSADHYDIPTLRRKPLPEPSTSNTPKHNRSFSHPFPSLFGSKKTSDKRSPLQQERAGPDNVDGPADSGRSKASTPRTLSKTPSRTDLMMTGKCMTCDSTVKWPSGLKVYRCTTCLTINDLEPYLEQKQAADGTPEPTFITPRKRMSSISVWDLC